MTTATKKTLALFALATLLLSGCVSTESSGSGGGRECPVYCVHRLSVSRFMPVDGL